jgi:preprotein translocase subunit YajC
MLISEAFAQTAVPGGAADPFLTFLPLILIFVVFYFLLIRPQQKRIKEHKAMIDAVRRGDKVVTGGGIIGTVVKVNDDNEVTVEIAEAVRVRVLKGTISSVMQKTEPVKDAEAAKS